MRAPGDARAYRSTQVGQFRVDVQTERRALPARDWKADELSR